MLSNECDTSSSVVKGEDFTFVHEDDNLFITTVASKVLGNSSFDSMGLFFYRLRWWNPTPK